MIYPKDFIFSPIRVQRLLELSRTFQIVTKWLLNLDVRETTDQCNSSHKRHSIGRRRQTNNYPRNSPIRVAKLLQPLRHGHKDLRRQRKVKQAILLLLAVPDLIKSLLESLEGFVSAFMAGHITASVAELLQLLGESRTFQLDGCSDDLDEVVWRHLVGGESDDF